MKAIFSIMCMSCAVLFGIAETQYFGNNFLPATWEEMLCDITGFLLFTCGYVLFRQASFEGKKMIKNNS